MMHKSVYLVDNLLRPAEIAEMPARAVGCDRPAPGAGADVIGIMQPFHPSPRADGPPLANAVIQIVVIEVQLKLDAIRLVNICQFLYGVRRGDLIAVTDDNPVLVVRPQ